MERASKSWNRYSNEFNADVLAIRKGVCTQHVLIIHEVESYPAWKAIFGQAVDMRKRAGEINCQLLRYDNHAKFFTSRSGPR